MKKAVTALIGLAVMVAVFAFLFPHLADYEQAFARLRSMSTVWEAALVAACVVNIAIYPLTALAAIPHIGYRAAFVERQAGFLISNIVPGGGAFAVGTQYAILARYGISSQSAAAAVSADALWTYLMTLGFPSIAVVMLVIEGRSAAAYTTVAAVGLVVVIASVIGVWLVLRSQDSARRLAGWLQPLANRTWRLFKKDAPDLADVLVEFNVHASTMIKHRWPQLTVTNLAAQLAPMLVLWFALIGMGAYPDPLTLVEIFAAYSIALILTSFPITPGGLGTVDAALVGLLVAFGVDSATAVAADLVWRLVWFLPQLAVGLGAFTWNWWEARHHAG